MLTNLQIAREFEKLSIALQVIDAKKFFFQIRSYETAQEVIRNLTKELSQLYEEKQDLDKIDGIGPAIEHKIIELLTKGYSDEMKLHISSIPQAIFELTDIPGIGAKRALRLTTEFDLKEGKAIEQLAKVAEAGKIRELDGFGEKSEKDIIDSIRRISIKHNSFTYDEAIDLAKKLIHEIKKSDAVLEVMPLGSLRRKKAVVKDIDLGISTNDYDKVKEVIKKISMIKEILAEGDQLIRVLLDNNIQVDMKSSPPQRWGAFLQHFTGSKEHNIKLRELALRQGKSLSEHGIKLIDEEKRLVEFKTEEKFYDYLGLKWIDPTERLGGDEIEKAKKKN